jgi:hypothetical protein
MKKHHWHVFRHEKLFKKQPLPHYQTRSRDLIVGICCCCCHGFVFLPCEVLHVKWLRKENKEKKLLMLITSTHAAHAMNYEGVCNCSNSGFLKYFLFKNILK